MSRLVRALLFVSVAVLLLVACGGDTATEEVPGADGIRVAAFDFAESVLLAELYALVLESTGVPVVRLGPIGPREIVSPALELGSIDVIPEYLGTALRFAGATETNPDPVSARDELNELLMPKGLIALEPAAAEDTNAMVVGAETAERDDLETISDLTGVAAGLRFGGPVECPSRPQCLAGLETVYGLRFAEFVPQQSLAFTAEALRRGEIDVGLLFSTASELESPDFVELVDDRDLQPPENIVPVVRRDALQRWGPRVATGLDAVAQRLTTNDLRTMNVRVANGETATDVARSWLESHDLLRSE